MQKLVISSQEHLQFINQEDILFCKSDGCYTCVTLQSAKEFVICKPLAKVSKELDGDLFIRVNQSYLVNLNFITSIDKKKKILFLLNNTAIRFTTSIREIVIKVSKYRAIVFMQAVFNFLDILGRIGT